MKLIEYSNTNINQAVILWMNVAKNNVILSIKMLQRNILSATTKQKIPYSKKADKTGRFNPFKYPEHNEISINGGIENPKTKIGLDIPSTLNRISALFLNRRRMSTAKKPSASDLLMLLFSNRFGMLESLGYRTTIPISALFSPLTARIEMETISA